MGGPGGRVNNSLFCGQLAQRPHRQRRLVPHNAFQVVTGPAVALVGCLRAAPERPSDASPGCSCVPCLADGEVELARHPGHLSDELADAPQPGADLPIAINHG